MSDHCGTLLLDLQLWRYVITSMPEALKLSTQFLMAQLLQGDHHLGSTRKMTSSLLNNACLCCESLTAAQARYALLCIIAQEHSGHVG